jgi:hypothetical protein
MPSLSYGTKTTVMAENFIENLREEADHLSRLMKPLSAEQQLTMKRIPSTWKQRASTV